MSKLIQSYSSANPASGEDTPFLAALREEYPELAQALRGTKNVDGQCVLPPCTLMLFLDGERIGFCLSPKAGQRVAFGSLPDPSKGLAGVEAEIAAGHFEWKNKRGR